MTFLYAANFNLVETSPITASASRYKRVTCVQDLMSSLVMTQYGTLHSKAKQSEAKL